MKYRKTIDLWDGDNIERLTSGELALQPGQWVRCGSSQASRFCGVTPSGVIVAAHPEGESGVSSQRFKSCLQYAKTRKATP